ncbi:hypothetical protein ACFQDE_05935 [Deinococcus caeni]|uniref:hypothetical protein n=1 Tax=Deinococcus caeni TaxID=569127 RepID=UPI00361DB6E6
MGGRSRRVITLERPRNEHLRPVNITVQRMYFGDWTLENMPSEEGQGAAAGAAHRAVVSAQASAAPAVAAASRGAAATGARCSA